MKELSLHILDIAQNSLSAGAKNVEISILDSALEDKTEIVIKDDGCGMDPEFLSRVTDPFTTTRTTRKVGMGLPLLKMAAEMAEGSFQIESKVGEGTTVTARFRRSNIDRPPLGDMSGTMVTLVQGSPDTDFIYTYQTDSGDFTLRTEEIREILEGVSLSEPEVLSWIGEFLREKEISLNEQ